MINHNLGGKVGSSHKDADEEGLWEVVPVDDGQAICQDALWERLWIKTLQKKNYASYDYKVKVINHIENPHSK